MFKDKLLFVNFYSSLGISNYIMSKLPGKNENVNGSILGGFNMGINKHISDDRIKASIKVMKYLLSEEFQREVIVKKLNLYSSIIKLYDDDGVCSHINCNIIKDSHFFVRPSSAMKNYGSFSSQSVNYIQEFLKGKKSAKETLSDIDNIIRIYYLSMYSVIGLILYSLLTTMFCIIIISTCLIFINKYKIYFKFFSIDLWIIYSFGSVFMITSCFEYFNDTVKRKCILRHFFSELGNAFIYIPLLYKLLSNYPKINKFSEWIKKNKYLFILFLLSIHVIFTILVSISNSFIINEVVGYDNKVYNVCSYNNRYTGKILSYIQFGYNLLLYFLNCFLLFLEWNISETYYDIRHFTFVLIVDGITQLLIVSLNFIKGNNYMYYSILHIFINLLYVIFNHFYIFIIRLILLSLKDENEFNEEKFINDLIHFNDSFSSHNAGVSNIESKISGNSKQSDIKEKYSSKFINYHYSTSFIS